MGHRKLLAISLWMLACVGTIWAQDSPKSIAQVLDNRISGVEKEFVSAADAMPEDKYSFTPTNGEFKGVRTFGGQVKHVASGNYVLGAAILGEKPPVAIDDDWVGPESVKTKADIMKFTKDSFAYLHKAIASINEKNVVTAIPNPFGGKESATRLGIAVLAAQHPFDHYGQMVEYLRMNGIIPPASRQ